MVAYDERSGYRERLLKAEAELAEARAQIDQQAALLDTCGSQINDLEAQIAAKDAALRNIRELIWKGSHSGEHLGECMKIINAALAAPARETK
jgi:multidrug resistance efflux pump